MSDDDQYGVRDRGISEARISDCTRAVTCALSAGRTYGYADRRYMTAVEKCAPHMSDEWNEAPTRASTLSSDGNGFTLLLFMLGAAMVLCVVWMLVHRYYGSAL